MAKAFVEATTTMVAQADHSLSRMAIAMATKEEITEQEETDRDTARRTATVVASTKIDQKVGATTKREERQATTRTDKEAKDIKARETLAAILVEKPTKNKDSTLTKAQCLAAAVFRALPRNLEAHLSWHFAIQRKARYRSSTSSPTSLE